MTDRALYDGISRREDRAFQWIYDHNYQMIKTMILNNSGAEADAVDIFQEGLVALWVNIKKGTFQLTENTKLSTYFYRLCSNLWISRLRKKKLKIVSEAVVDIDNISDGDDETKDYERVRLLALGIKSLGENCQKILRLFYFDKSSLKSIGEKMGITEKTAKNNKYRCLQKLKEYCLKPAAL